MIKVGYQGKNGTYSELACLKYFSNEKIETKNYSEFVSLINDVENNLLDYAVLPVENSTTGIIYRTYDLFKNYNIYAIGEQYIKIDENLISIMGANKKTIKEVYSHPEALSQCRKYLTENNYKPVAYQDTASSVKYVKELNDKSKAALASSFAAKYYNMEIIESNVQDNQLNTTRFLVVSNKNDYLIDANKISMYFVVKHEPGSLYKVLEHFASSNINLLKLESRPLEDKLFEYCFYIDFIGNTNDSNIKQTLDKINNHCVEYKILGNYQKVKVND
jgi:chorismate mutase/prephenate dehydratase